MPNKVSVGDFLKHTTKNGRTVYTKVHCIQMDTQVGMKGKTVLMYYGTDVVVPVDKCGNETSLEMAVRFYSENEKHPGVYYLDYILSSYMQKLVDSGVYKHVSIE